MIDQENLAVDGGAPRGASFLSHRYRGFTAQVPTRH